MSLPTLFWLQINLLRAFKNQHKWLFVQSFLHNDIVKIVKEKKIEFSYFHKVFTMSVQKYIYQSFWYMIFHLH